MSGLNRRLNKLERPYGGKPHQPIVLPRIEAPSGLSIYGFAITSSGLVLQGDRETGEQFQQRINETVQPGRTMDDMTDQQLQECLDFLHRAKKDAIKSKFAISNRKEPRTHDLY